MEEQAAGISAAPAALPPMCLACGQMLTPEQAKCPSCGAPVRRPGRRGSPRRLTLAATLLLGLFLIAVVYGIFIVSDTGTLAEGGRGFPSRPFTFSGSVHDASGAPLGGVNVTAEDDRPHTTFTDANGSFALHGLSAGYHQLNLTATNGTSLHMRIFLLQDEHTNATLTAGLVDHPSYNTWEGIIGFCGSVLIALALLVLAGAIACYRRRLYPLVLTAAIASLVEVVVFLPAIVASILAIILIVRGRGDFL